MILPTQIDPCQQVRHAIVVHLQGLCNGFARPIPQTQIRAMLDVSGEPKDACGIVVACENAGEHWGANNGGVLVDVRPRIACWTHINEDADGSICAALASDVAEAMRGIEYALDGWYAAWRGNWTIGESEMEGSFRRVELSATIPLVKN